jgi:primosomal protein N'
MLQFGGCPRCRGDLFLDDQDGLQDLVCLQCGYRRPLPAKAGVGRTAAGLQAVRPGR